MMQDNFLSD